MNDKMIRIISALVVAAVLGIGYKLFKKSYEKNNSEDKYTVKMNFVYVILMLVVGVILTVVGVITMMNQPQEIEKLLVLVIFAVICFVSAFFMNRFSIKV